MHRLPYRGELNSVARVPRIYISEERPEIPRLYPVLKGKEEILSSSHFSKLLFRRSHLDLSLPFYCPSYERKDTARGSMRFSKSKDILSLKNKSRLSIKIKQNKDGLKHFLLSVYVIFLVNVCIVT